MRELTGAGYYYTVYNVKPTENFNSLLHSSDRCIVAIQSN
jgi:hypothetical protein